jgi:hypothetical protein
VKDIIIQEIMKPVMLLAAWTMIMWVWMYVTRVPAMNRSGIMEELSIGSTGQSLRADLVAKGEVRASWVADNYNHLHEAPTVFYAVAIILAMLNAGDGINAYIAWAYVALRIAHSFAQVTINHVLSRFILFTLSTLCLIALIVHGFAMVFDLHLPHL